MGPGFCQTDVVSKIAERVARGGGSLVLPGKGRHLSGHLLPRAPGAGWQAPTMTLFHPNGALGGWAFLTADSLPTTQHPSPGM